MRFAAMRFYEKVLKKVGQKSVESASNILLVRNENFWLSKKAYILAKL